MARQELQYPEAVKELLKKFAQNSGCAVSHIFLAAIVEKLGLSLDDFPNKEAIEKILDTERYNNVRGLTKQKLIEDAAKIEYTPEKYVKFLEINGFLGDKELADQYRKFILEDYAKEGLRQKIALIRDFNSRLQNLLELHSVGKGKDKGV